MIEEAMRCGLATDRKRYETVVPRTASTAEYRTDDEDQETEFHSLPDFRGPIHESLRGFWWIPEFIPKMYFDPRDEYRRKLMIPRGRRRWIPEGSIIHESVLHRMRDQRCAIILPTCPGNTR